ncbi:NAD(P)H-dependent FMN reductase [Streptomyces sp. V3I7]|nr:NAD(P)H-dependent FMN reductase [Streptomyces sp. V3I7]
MTRRFLFVLGSARPDGNTELLARRAADQLPADVEQQWISLAEHPLPDFPTGATTAVRTRARPPAATRRCCSTPRSPRRTS